jgi:hypothetical protein
MPTRIRSLALLLLGLIAALSPILRAQQPDPPPEGPLHTLHVYMDLIQVPVLVLDSELGRMKPVEPSRFHISLDSGPTFRPRHVRQEGDDPITLGILLDPNADPDVMPRMSAAISGLAPGSLHPRDHVTVFVLDCTLVRALRDVPADPNRLKAGVDNALDSWVAARKLKHRPPCAKSVQLWDAMAFVVNELGNLPGRRVLLAVTDGQDKGSSTKWNELRSFAQLKGVAVFGYTPSSSFSDSRIATPASSGGRLGSRSIAGLPSALAPINAPENPFSSICQLSGGMVASANSRYLDWQLSRFVTTVRERYILEFSRARNDTPGEHSIAVTINKDPSAYIRPAGVMILMPDAALASDPNTIPRDSTDAPELGNRKPLKSPK